MAEPFSTSPAVVVAGVARPKEHGAWAMVGEMALATLAVGASWSGVLLLVSVIFVFLARAAVRWAFTSNLAERKKRSIRQVVVCCVLALGLTALGLWMLAASAGLVVLLLSLAVLPGAGFVVLDIQSQGRSLFAQIFACLSIAVAAAAILAANQQPVAMVYLVSGLLGIRFISSIFLIRHLLRRAQKRASSIVPVVVTLVCVLVFSFVGESLGWLGVYSIVALWLLVFRAVIYLWFWHPRQAKQIGQLEVGVGVVYVGLLIAEMWMQSC